jgi:carboxyl-terminal processing protease
MSQFVVAQPALAQHVLKNDRTMGEGLIGLDVLALEEALQLLGHNPGAVDGVYTEDTARAVNQLQVVQGLAGSGVADGETVIAINGLLKQFDLNAAQADDQLAAAVKLINEWRAGQTK